MPTLYASQSPSPRASVKTLGQGAAAGAGTTRVGASHRAEAVPASWLKDAACTPVPMQSPPGSHGGSHAATLVGYWARVRTPLRPALSLPISDRASFGKSIYGY